MPGSGLAMALESLSLQPGSSLAVDSELHASDDVEDFVERLANGTLRFRDRAVAAGEGYRPLGPDFPGMGEHWVQPGRVFAGDVDPACPPILTYAELAGRVTLVGAAFTHFLDPSVEPPSLFEGAASWGRQQMDEEVLFLTHQPFGHGDVRWLQRAAIVHTWLLDNPRGVTEQNNWRLPFLRLGLEAPAGAPVDAARALSLLAGEGYYGKLFDFAGWLDHRERVVVAQTLAIHAARVQRWVFRALEVGVTATGELSEVWKSLWRRLESELEPEAWERLSEPMAGLR
jgi:hypothetical protein